MKGESDTIPANFVRSNGKTQCNYNIKQVQKTDSISGKARTVFEYEYVEIEGEVTKEKFLSMITTDSWTPSTAVLENTTGTLQKKIIADLSAIKTKIGIIETTPSP